MCLSSFNEALEHVPLPLRPDPLRPVSGSSRTKSRLGCPLSQGDLHSTVVPRQAIPPPFWGPRTDRSHTVAKTQQLLGRGAENLIRRPAGPANAWARSGFFRPESNE